MNCKIFVVLAAVVFCSVTISLAADQDELGNPLLYPQNNLNDPLIKAAFDGDLKGVKDAIASGSYINVTNDEGIAALCFASLKGHTKIVKTLRAAGADVNKIEKKYGGLLYILRHLKGIQKLSNS
jgi:ankyrin repeat protein